jgi:hypothetical protein
MRIEQNFPLECCEKCKSVRPYTNEQRLYSYEEVVDQVIVVGCEHEQECTVIYKFLKEQMGRTDECN